MAEEKDSNDSKLLSGAVKAASYNMVLQLMLRVMTFLINGVVIRFISKDMLGVVNVRLTLLYSTTLFLATEAFDKACLSKIENQNWSKVINLMWCTVPMSVLVSSILGWVWIYLLETPDPNMIPNYTLGVISFSISTVLVILSRPLYILAQKCMFIKLKVMSAGIAEIFKCIITVILVIFFPQLGIINFAIAQIIFGLVTSVVYYSYIIYYILYEKKKDDNFPLSNIRQLFPSRLDDSTFIDINQAWLAVSIFTQSFFKQLLTEGERYIMTIFGVLSFADQGIYDIVNNLGSMAARFIFLPIEESGYLFFSQLLIRGEPVNKQKQNSCQLAVDVLSILLKMVILIGVIILMFGLPYSYLALDLYGGSLLSSGTGPTLLRWYCLYVLVIAVNGTTECFVFATMSRTQVDRYNKKMVIFSGLFLLSSIILVNQFGSVGFILANCLNMGARIVHSIYYIHEYFKESKYSPLHDILPSNIVILVLVISLCITTLSETIFCCDRGLVYRLLHIFIGGLCFIVTLATIYLKETTVIRFIKDHIGGKHKLS